jgi:hypothetical protein
MARRHSESATYHCRALPRFAFRRGLKEMPQHGEKNDRQHYIQQVGYHTAITFEPAALVFRAVGLIHFSTPASRAYRIALEKY